MSRYEPYVSEHNIHTKEGQDESMNLERDNKLKIFFFFFGGGGDHDIAYYEMPVKILFI